MINVQRYIYVIYTPQWADLKGGMVRTAFRKNQISLIYIVKLQKIGLRKKMLDSRLCLYSKPHWKIKKYTPPPKKKGSGGGDSSFEFKFLYVDLSNNVRCTNVRCQKEEGSLSLLQSPVFPWCNVSKEFGSLVNFSIWGRCVCVAKLFHVF